MFVAFCGYRVLHVIERWAWVPVVLAFILLTSFGGRHLGAATSFASDVPATAANVLSFLSIIVGFTISWSGCSGDFNTYMRCGIYYFAFFFCPTDLLSLTARTFPQLPSRSTPSSASTCRAA